MKIQNTEYYIIVTFTPREKASGLPAFLEQKMPFFGTSFSEDRLTWQIDTAYIEKFHTLIKKYQAKNSQMKLF